MHANDISNFFRAQLPYLCNFGDTAAATHFCFIANAKNFATIAFWLAEKTFPLLRKKCFFFFWFATEQNCKLRFLRLYVVCRHSRGTAVS